jgi:hypothetical protein
VLIFIIKRYIMIKVKGLIIFISIMLFFIFLSCPGTNDDSGSVYGGNTTRIIDHTCINLDYIPQEAITNAKNSLHIGYGHTSHGSQLPTGMSGLDTFKGGKGIYVFSSNGAEGTLHLYEGSGYDTTGDLALDCGYSGWNDRTKAFLGTPDSGTGRGTAHPDFNVIIWSWCGQVASKTAETMVSDYLALMAQLEIDYPGVTFVYMTGHMYDAGDELTGNNHLRNEQIRAYCRANNKWLYDFNDIEAYNPDGVYFGDKLPDDNCDYDADGAMPRTETGNWATEWQSAHTVNVDWYDCSPAHSQAVNGNMKAYAAWWLWARLAGWSGKN